MQKNAFHRNAFCGYVDSELDIYHPWFRKWHPGTEVSSESIYNRCPVANFLFADFFGSGYLNLLTLFRHDFLPK